MDGVIMEVVFWGGCFVGLGEWVLVFFCGGEEGLLLLVFMGGGFLYHGVGLC
jgi:hypothetical protein